MGDKTDLALRLTETLGRQRDINRRMVPGASAAAQVAAPVAPPVRLPGPERTEREVAIFSSPYVPAIAESAPHVPQFGGKVVVIIAAATVAGTTASTLTLKHNGVLVATFNLGSGLTITSYTPTSRIDVLPDVDRLVGAITAVGSNVKGISMFVRLRT